VHSEGPQGRTSLFVKDFDPEFKTTRDFGAAKKEWDDARENAKKVAAAQQAAQQQAAKK